MADETFYEVKTARLKVMTVGVAHPDDGLSGAVRLPNGAKFVILTGDIDDVRVLAAHLLDEIDITIKTTEVDAEFEEPADG